MKTLSIDIETYSSVNLVKSGVYRYVEAPDFSVLLFAFSADNGPVQVIDLACGETIPSDVLSALTDESVGRSYSGLSVFATKVICGDCGGFYGKKVWHSNDAYRKEIWRCNAKFNGKKKCSTPSYDTETIKNAYLRAYSILMGSRDELLAACEAMRELVSDCTELDEKIDSLNEELQVVSELVTQCVKENACTAQSQEEYSKKYTSLVRRYEKEKI